MKPTITIACAIALLLCAWGCTKNKDNAPASVTSADVVRDAVGVIIMPQYNTLLEKAGTLNVAVTARSSTPSAGNLANARAAWRDVRAAWEQCEGFLLGPVEDDNYDPNMDTWPVDHRQLDSFITSSSTIDAPTIAGLNQALRGFHPLEYILWGKDGNATADSISDREKLYMVALAQDIQTTVTALNHSWEAGKGNFRDQLLLAGKGSARYNNNQEVLLAIADAMAGICEEVGGGKIYEPFNEYDSTKTESPFSHNSITDFTHNMVGAKNVYLCTVNGATGASLSALVSSRNLSLNNTIIAKFDAAITALNTVNATFEYAIYNRRVQLQNAMTAINDLHEVLDHDLKNHIITYVKD